MRIGIEVQRLFRQNRYGIEISAIELINELIKLNSRHEILVFASTGPSMNFFKGCSQFNVKKLYGKFFVDFEQIMLPLAVRREQIDLLHCTGNTTPIYCSRPVIQTLHDIIFLDRTEGKDIPYQRFGNLYRRLVVPCSVRKSRAIITVSNFEKKRISERLCVDEKKITVIHNGVNTRFTKTVDQELLRITQAKYNLPNKFILFLGNTSARKNSTRVLDAYTEYAHRVQDPVFLVTPGLSPEFIKNHLKKTDSLSILRNIITPGYIDENDLVHLYSLSSLFLYPSLSEGFGMPLLEAMSCGTPVITSNLSCLPEIAGDAAILTNPYDVHDISDSLIKVLSHPILQNDLINKGYKRIQHFQWKTAAEKTLELYERIHEKES